MSINAKAKKWIDKLNLSPHPEGGYYNETYRSLESMQRDHLPGRFSGNRVFATAIYFLLVEPDFSAFHRIKQDEIWHFYDGSALTIHIIDTTGKYFTKILGRDPDNAEEPQVMIKAGNIFGAAINTRSSYTLAGCTVAPGFDYADFEIISKADLLKNFPGYKEIIGQLTR